MWWFVWEPHISLFGNHTYLPQNYKLYELDGWRGVPPTIDDSYFVFQSFLLGGPPLYKWFYVGSTVKTSLRPYIMWDI